MVLNKQTIDALKKALSICVNELNVLNNLAKQGRINEKEVMAISLAETEIHQELTSAIGGLASIISKLGGKFSRF